VASQGRASFPLFQMIYNNVLSKYQEEEFQQQTIMMEEISSSQKTKICRIIKEMDEHHMELIFALIRCYQLQIDQQSILQTPYHMKKVKPSQYRFDIDQLPTLLHHIILNFVELYEKQSEMNNNLNT
jgi:hypothetical protein